MIIAAYLIAKGFDVYGLDISPKQIEYAKQVIPEAHLFNDDLIDFTTNIKFDAIICWWTLFHIHADYHLDVLKKLNSFLKPKGILQITFADTSYVSESNDVKVIDEHTIESTMFGARFYHSGNSADINSRLTKSAGFHIMKDICDQPGNQVILANKK